jgi:hypothetical protein
MKWVGAASSPTPFTENSPFTGIFCMIFFNILFLMPNIFFCKNSSRIPNAEPARLAWILAIKSALGDEWNVERKHNYVCSEHFLESDIIPNGIIQRLKNVSTVPTQNLPSRAGKENDNQVQSAPIYVAFK